MKVLGVVCEYNPFHNGHKYLIEKAKELTGADFVIAIMSGNFTQSGNIAIYDKFTRAKLAIDNGLDLVIELPCIFAISSASYFASKAIQILDALNIVDYICFGCEDNNLTLLQNISNTIINKEENIWNDTKNFLDTGISFANARENALKNYLSSEEVNIASKSNNILAIEYLKELKRLNSKISPIAIKREGADFNSVSLNKDNFISATAIRNYIFENKEKNLSYLKKYVPNNVLEVINNTNAIFNDDFFNFLKFRILDLTKNELQDINEVTEGLENKIIKSISTSYTYNDFIKNIKSKRYQMSKIKRILLNILLNITKEDFNLIFNSNSLYAHILNVSDAFKSNIGYITKKSSIPIIINKKDFDNIKDDLIKKSISYDLYASNLYSLIKKEALNKDFTNKI